jgi:hypothetical protein
MATAAVSSAAASTVTGPPVYVTIGVEVVSQNSNGKYMYGSQTLSLSQAVTEGTGTLAKTVELESNNGTTALVVEAECTTSTAALPMMTAATTSSAAPQKSEIIVNGHTYYIGPASLNPGSTGSVTASSGFKTTATYATPSGPKATTTSKTPTTQNAGARASLSLVLAGSVAMAMGIAALL